MIALVTDSNTMVPRSLRERFGIRQVPLSVVVDGDSHAETDDLDLTWFYEKLRAGAAVSTAAPAPGAAAAVYRDAEKAGAEAVLSVHVGADYSATLNAVSVAAGMVDIPIEIVDTTNASFAAGLSVWRAAELVHEGRDIAAAAAGAREVAGRVASVFTVAEVSRARAGGRLGVAEEGDGVPVLAMAGPDLHEIGRADSIDAAVEAMVDTIRSVDGALRIGVGGADADEAVTSLRSALELMGRDLDVITYTVGPTVAAHTGAGTFGAVYHPS